ncbi:hypothetical protein HO133_003657 [Letharia lupina]|uniref:RNase III domain-containing protein n=1 Tax=Letharia lupina TaxID=560253 RepID=A0A8H6F933_9LECA|nr:uncharacterized protein HO133_003657 [Letharia lupina]KAF6219832.1 hypothetical protein HO133_003657 [Letharia lupina]
MGKKRSHDSGGGFLESSQKKQKHTASSSDKSLIPKPASSHVGQSLSQVSESQKNTRKLVSEPLSDSDREAHDHPQEASKSTQAQVQDPRLSGYALHVKQSNANGDSISLGKALNFPVFQQSSSVSTQHRPSSTSPKESVKFPPYNGRPSTLPPLPPILDKALQSVAFTHPGSLSCDTASKVNISYDRLEFLGDAYIELMATRVIFPRFPRLAAGRLSQQREMLVKNETLAEYALAYGFDEKAKLPSTYNTPGKDSRKLWLKTLGDIFEAFVAAVIISDPEQGFQVAEAWLAALWELKLGSQKREDTEIVDPKAKMQLAAKIMGKGIKIHYRDEAPPVEIRQEGKLIFQVGVYLTGWGWEDQHLGSGKGLNKQEAGQKAAADAMVNPLTAQVASVKRDFDAQVALERSFQDEADKEKQGGVGRL